MNASVVIAGNGLLADYTAEELESRSGFHIVRLTGFAEGTDMPDAADLLLVLHDGWAPADHLAAEEASVRTGTPWLRAFAAFGEGIVGPFVRPGKPGCSQCADIRRLLAGRDRMEMWELQRRVKADRGEIPNGWASRPALRLMSAFLADEAEAAVRGHKPRTEERIGLFQLLTLQNSFHRFLPDPLCPVCGNLPEDSADGARIALKSNPKASPDVYRVRPMEELKAVLADRYLDPRTGFLNGRALDLVSPFADASVNLPLLSGDEGCAGRTHNYADSVVTAILEGIERYCGMSPRGKRTAVYASYRELKSDALDPLRVGVHAKEQYDQPDFPFQPFDPEQPIDWVWGYSFLQERPILVPELLAYYSTGCGHGFVYETSNGCALGGSLEEAIFYGILEVVERDSFLMTWYGRLPLPRLDPATAGPELALMVERVKAVAGFDIHLFDSTMEHGIPSVWALAKNAAGRGINLICAAGAHPDPVRAAKGAVHEIAGMLLTLNDKFEAQRERYERMLDDPFLVAQMEDHSMLYGLPQAEERLGFLLGGSRPQQPFFERYAPRARHADLTDDLNDMLKALRRLQLDVIVVDQTTEETRRSGLHCVKVLIPGMLPMTFGHRLVRLEGLDRALRVPAELGYVRQPLTAAQLNPYPHPFP